MEEEGWDLLGRDLPVWGLWEGDSLAWDPQAWDPQAWDPLAWGPQAWDPWEGGLLAWDPLAWDPWEGDSPDFHQHKHLHYHRSVLDCKRRKEHRSYM